MGRLGGQRGQAIGCVKDSKCSNPKIVCVRYRREIRQTDGTRRRLQHYSPGLAEKRVLRRFLPVRYARVRAGFLNVLALLSRLVA